MHTYVSQNSQSDDSWNIPKDTVPQNNIGRHKIFFVCACASLRNLENTILFLHSQPNTARTKCQQPSLLLNSECQKEHFDAFNYTPYIFLFCYILWGHAVA
jgi:hypothetical protein